MKKCFLKFFIIFSILMVYHLLNYEISASNINDGIYEIETAVDSNKVLDVIDASQISGGNVQIYTKNNGDCQKVKIKSLNNGYYTITFLHSNMLLDVSNGKTADHTNVWQCRENYSDAQKWIIQDAGNGYYNIISKLKNKYLTVDNGKTSNCTNIEISSENGHSSQRFKLNRIEKTKGTKTIEDGIYEIETGVNGNKALDVINAVTYSGGNVQIFTKNQADCQKLNVKYAGDGYYTIEFVHSKKLLDVSNGKKENHTNVWQCTPNGADAQKWIIQEFGDGYYNIISKVSNTYLTVAGGKTANCTNIEINTKQNNSSQKFKFNKIEKAHGKQTIEDGTYEIESAVNSNKVLEVIDASQISGANVQIFTRNNLFYQNVNIKYIGEGYYTIEFVHSNKFLDVSNGETSDHTNVWQCTPNGSDAQKWIIQEASNGYYNIISKVSDTFLTVENGKSDNTTNIEINKKMNNSSQMFKFNKINPIERKETIETGLYEIETSVDKNKVLDVIDASQISGGNVQIYTKNNARCQKVIVDYIENGYYVLTFLHSGMMLDVSNGSTYNHTNVWQCKENYSDAQKWIIQETGDGYFNIVSKLGNIYLTVKNGDTANCTNIEVNSNKNNNSQKFKFNKIDEFYSAPVISEGIYEISTKLNSNKVIEVINADVNSEANVQLFTRNSEANCQKMYIKHIGDGMYNIEFLHSGNMLDIDNNSTEKYMNVWQDNKNGEDTQVWTIRSTHDGYYNIVSKSNKLYLTVVNGITANGTNIEIGTPTYSNNQKFKFNKTSIAKDIGQYGNSGLVYKGDSNGSKLKYYKYGFGNNVLFATFAVHGFEDNWYRDGQALTEIANAYYNRLIKDCDLEIAENWSIYIFPSVNPDGEYYGESNNGSGRCTLWSSAPGNQGIDINRNWKCSGIEYKRFTSSRNYNGTAGFQAYEASALKEFMLSHKATLGKTIVIDLHGWENSLIGNQEILDYFYPNFSSATKKYEQYGQQYLISWARSDLGAQSALIELPSWIKNMQDVYDNNLINKYISSSINMLKNISTNTKRMLKSKNNKNENNITNEEQFNIAYAGLIKGGIPSEEEVKQYYNQQPVHTGIWIEEKSKSSILKMINEMTNLEYEIDTNNNLKLKEGQQNITNNEYDSILQELINSDSIYILTQTGKFYFRDVVTGNITEDLYENLDPYQTYNYTQNGTKTIIDITSNLNKKINNKEIFESIINLLKK